jgi:transcriptional regulator with XRE-family HTH domain
MIRLGRTARHLRESLGLTQRAAAQSLGISAVHLCNIEKGNSVPSPELLTRYRNTWGIDLYVLAWCLHGNTKDLPPAIRKPMRDLAKVWERQLAEKGLKKRMEAQYPCSESAK